MDALGWDELDILLVSGDAYVDHHSFGTSLLGRWLVAHGFRTGIVSQPNWESTDDVSRLGRPRLFAGVAAGALDSLVAHYTAFRKKRSTDAYSPGGAIGLRPNRAVLVYTGLVRSAFPGLVVVAGGIEASLRRATHYDFWSDALRRSIVLDAKADAVLYGMGELSILALAQLLADTPARQRPGDAVVAARLPGTAYAVHPDKVPEDAEILPSHEAILDEPGLLMKATLAFERQMLQGGPCLVQRSGGRTVVFEPPSRPLTGSELDAVHELPFTRRAHPSYTEPVPAVTMVADSVTSHRGCAGGCSFCSLALHQGRRIQSRSAGSIRREIEAMTKRPEWKGSISDVGGPSANMWNAICNGDPTVCKRESCLYPKRCRHFHADQEGQADMLRELAKIPGVDHLRVASGVRHDLAIESEAYMAALVGDFTGGQLKIAPEHLAERVLRLMRKTPQRTFETFLRSFNRLSAEAGKEQYVIPYLMSGFPGCTDDDMKELAAWLRRRNWRPQQIQSFIPTPGTVATAMFFTKQDQDGRPIFVARTDAERLRQHYILVPDEAPPPAEQEEIRRPRPERFADSRSRNDGPRSGPPRGDRPRSDRPRPSGPRSDRPRGDWSKSDKPRSDWSRTDRPQGDRPARRPAGDRSRSDRPRSDWSKTDRPRSDRPRSDRPQSDRPRSDRPRGEWSKSDRPRSDRPYKDRAATDRPKGDWPKSGRPRTDRPRSDSSPRPRPSGDRPASDRSGSGAPYNRDQRPRPVRPSRPYNSDSGRFRTRPGKPSGPPRRDAGPRPPRPNRPGRSGGFKRRDRDEGGL